MARVQLRGRSHEVSTAVALVRAAARTHQSGVIMVTGEAGIGKTAVFNAVSADAVDEGFVLGASKADSMGQISPGAPLLLALRSGPSPLLDSDAFTELTELLAQPLLLVDRISGHLESIAAVTPVLIAVDDVHWADQLSVFALRILMSRLAGSPVVWMFTSRNLAEGLVWDLSLPGIADLVVETIHLGPLDPGDVDAIARDRLGAEPSQRARDMLDKVGGIPFLVVQLLDGLVRSRARGDSDEQTPPEFILGVRRTLGNLAAEEVELVRVAAVLGRPFAIEEIAGLMGDHTAGRVADWLGRVIASGLIANAGATMTFRHDLVRETIYADLTDQTRRALHRRCAAYLIEARGSALAAAPHALAAAVVGDNEAVAILRRAAEEAVTAMPGTAGDLIRRAFELTRPTHPRWLETGEQCVDILSRVQRAADAVDVADILLGRVDDPERAARIQVLAARALWLGGRLALLVSRVEQTLRRPGVSDALRARLEASRALALTRLDPTDAVRRDAGVALAHARRVDDQPARLLAIQALGEAAKNIGHHHESYTLFRELRELAGTTYLAQEIMGLQHLDRYAEADAMLRAARQDAANNVEAVLPSLLFAQMWQDADLANIDDAESGARTLIDLCQELGNHMYEIEAWMVLSAQALRRGDFPEARRRLEPTDVPGVADDDVRVPYLNLMKGWLDWMEGDVTHAHDILVPALYAARESRAYWPWWPGWMRLFTVIGLVTGDARFAEESVAVAEQGAAMNPGIASFEGIAIQLRGLVRADLPMLRRASDVLLRSPRPLLQASGLNDYARALLGAGRPAEAVPLFEHALAIYDRLGHEPGRQRMHSQLRRAGVRRVAWDRPHRRPDTGWEALTETERKVARLISAGHTNRSAAKTLSVSTNTVGTHLRSIFAKLQVRSRVQLTNVVNGHPGPAGAVTEGPRGPA